MLCSFGVFMLLLPFCIVSFGCLEMVQYCLLWEEISFLRTPGSQKTMQWDRITLTDCLWVVPDQVSHHVRGQVLFSTILSQRVFSSQLSFFFFWSVCFLASLNMWLTRLWPVCHTGISTGWYFFLLFPLLFTVRHRCCPDWCTRSV